VSAGLGRYCVYQLLGPGGSVFYVGKGQGRRAWSRRSAKTRVVKHIRPLEARRQRATRRVIARDLDELQAVMQATTIQNLVEAGTILLNAEAVRSRAASTLQSAP
jgi:hypothetical protein